MTQVWSLVIIVLCVLLVERLSITLLTKSASGCRWVKTHWILHPNTISLIRIPMGVVSMLLWLKGWHQAAILWFAVWMISDLTDGTIARNCDLGTERGEWLDPLSDKCMYFPALALLAWQGLLPVPWVVALLVIDALGQLSRLVSQKKAANYFGKAKTALITILLSLAGLNQVHELWFMSERFVDLLTFSCMILAFLSVYCKVVPDLWYANSLTLANFLCGLAAIWNIAKDKPLRGLVLVFVGQFFDLFDGRLARKFGSTRHGAIFDDIADGTSFGLAVGFLVYHQLRHPSRLPPAVASLAMIIYTVAVFYRLYRFLNPVKAMPPGIFQGLPSPAGALLAGAAVLLFAPTLPSFALLLVLVAAGLMISSIPYRHFGHHIWPSLPNAVRLLCFVAFLVYVNISIADKDVARSFMLFCFILAVGYVFYGVDWRRVRSRGGASGKPAVSAPPSPG